MFASHLYECIHTYFVMLSIAISFRFNGLLCEFAHFIHSIQKYPIDMEFYLGKYISSNCKNNGKRDANLRSLNTISSEFILIYLIIPFFVFVSLLFHNTFSSFLLFKVERTNSKCLNIIIESVYTNVNICTN